VDVSARFVLKVPTQDGFEVELEDVVREVVRYQNPHHLNHELSGRTASSTSCIPTRRCAASKEIYADTQEKQYDGLSSHQTTAEPLVVPDT